MSIGWEVLVFCVVAVLLLTLVVVLICYLVRKCGANRGYKQSQIQDDNRSEVMADERMPKTYLEM